MDMHDPIDPDAAGRGPKSRVRSSSIGRALVAWILICGPACFLLYRYVEPTYETMALLRVEPAVEQIHSPDLHRNTSMEEIRPYLRTQVRLITSDRVLDKALARKEIHDLPMVRSSLDPKADLRRELDVKIVGEDTYLITVSFASKDPIETAAIVNAVVDEYLEQHTRFQNNANRALKKAMQSEQQKLEQQIHATRDRLAVLLEGKDDGARGGEKVRQLDAELLLMDMQSSRRKLEVIKSKLAQLDFENGQEAFRIMVQDVAAVPRAPSENRRSTYMATLAAVGLLLIVGLSWLGDLRARRATVPKAES